MARGSRGTSARSGRETNLKRQPSRREPRKSFLISTNGKSTERDYLIALKALPWVQAGRVVVVFKNGSPLEVVRDASRRKNANDFDIAWVVCDVDDFDIDRAVTEARRRDVEVAWANPCFELWLILHLAEQAAHIDNAGKACERISKLLGKPYDKTALNFLDFSGGISVAVSRAQLMDQTPTKNPSTNIWALLKALGYDK